MSQFHPAHLHSTEEQHQRRQHLQNHGNHAVGEHSTTTAFRRRFKSLLFPTGFSEEISKEWGFNYDVVAKEVEQPSQVSQSLFAFGWVMHCGAALPSCALVCRVFAPACALVCILHVPEMTVWTDAGAL